MSSSSRSPVFLLALGLLSCSGFYREQPCGRQRTVTARDSLAATAVGPSVSRGASFTAVDEESRWDVISWEIRVAGLGDSVTAVHLHDQTPGSAGRILYEIPESDAEPGPDFGTVGALDYSYTTSIESLFQLLRSGQTYIDIHTASQPDGELRADLTEVRFEDWSGYFCS